MNSPTFGADPEQWDPRRLSADQIIQILSAPEAAGIDPAGVADRLFLRLVSTASRDQIEAVMRSEVRSRVLSEIFRRMGQYVRPGQLPGGRSVVHWHIGERPEGGFDEFETILDPTGVTVSTVPEHHPRVTLITGSVDFVRLVTGQASGPLLFITGKLKIKGDLGYAAALPSIFVIPKA